MSQSTRLRHVTLLTYYQPHQLPNAHMPGFGGRKLWTITIVLRHFSIRASAGYIKNYISEMSNLGKVIFFSPISVISFCLSSKQSLPSLSTNWLDNNLAYKILIVWRHRASLRIKISNFGSNFRRVTDDLQQ